MDLGLGAVLHLPNSVSRRLVRHSAHKRGQPPGTVIHVGAERAHRVQLSLLRYTPDAVEERRLAGPDEAIAVRDAPGVKWITVDGVHDAPTIEALGAGFGIHGLVQEDIANTTQRPKCDPFEPYVYLVLPMLTFDVHALTLRAEQVSLVVGPDWVLSFLEDPGDVFDPVRDRLRTGHGRSRALGADYLAYALVDVIVDGYFAALEGLGDVIEKLEADVLADPSVETQQRLLGLRRELIFMRRAAWPVRELLTQIDRSESPIIQDDTRPFFRDTYDHAVQVLDVVESMRDLMSSLTDLYMSSLSNRMNEIMKFLTLVGTIFIPLTFIAGVYGMNFHDMPELDWHYGYPASLTLMGLVAVGMVLFFKHKRWL